ncbi:MAG TPA: type II toxin-antitoxin system HicB family antitoxin [Chloroflexota bacterium]|jgi:predicted RNase H-like HicB family nuclease
MSEHEYTVILQPDEEDGGYTVTVPALPGCVTEGDTLEEAVEMAKEAIEGYLEALAKRGQPAPEERNHPQLLTVNVAVTA